MKELRAETRDETTAMLSLMLESAYEHRQLAMVAAKLLVEHKLFSEQKGQQFILYIPKDSI